MRGDYPNLPLIEEKFRNIPKVASAIWEAALIVKARSNLPFITDIRCETFMQSFPNAAGIFENGGVSGQAFTDQYITVIWEVNTRIYAVFGGNRLAYCIQNPTDRFLEDWREHHMAVMRHVEDLYKSQDDLPDEEEDKGETK